MKTERRIDMDKQVTVFVTTNTRLGVDLSVVASPGCMALTFPMSSEDALELGKTLVEEASRALGIFPLGPEPVELEKEDRVCGNS